MINYKKEKVHATISPFIKKKAEEIVDFKKESGNKDFSSMSDFISIAMQKLIDYYESGLYTPQQNNIMVKSKTEYSASSLSHAHVLTELAELSKQAGKEASQAGNHAAAHKHLEESIGYYKQLLDETKKPMSDDINVVSARKNLVSSKTARIEENDIEIIE